MRPRPLLLFGVCGSLGLAVVAPLSASGDDGRIPPNTIGPRVEAPVTAHRPVKKGPIVVHRPAAGAGLMLGAFPLDLAFPYGVIFDTDAIDLWIGDIGGSPDFPGDGLDHRVLADGTPTNDTIDGRQLGLTPMDGAFNANTHTLWQVSGLFGIGCVYELDPETRSPTFRSICPPFATDQSALAYDPETDSFFSGSLNDALITHFDSGGAILDSAEVVAHVSGLAFNPATGHLFVLHQDVGENAGPDVFVVDPRFGDLVVGGFYVGDPGSWGPGMRGMEIDCDGNLWIVSQPGDVPYLLEVASGEPGPCAAR